MLPMITGEKRTSGMRRHKPQFAPERGFPQVKRTRGAEDRGLIARDLLLNPGKFDQASKEDVQAVAEYVREKRWKSLYHHDRRVYKLLKAGAQVLKDRSNIPPPPRPSPLDNVACLKYGTQDLRDKTGNLCAKATAKLFGVKPYRLARWLGQKSSVVTRDPSAGFLQNGLMYLERIAWLRVVLSDKAFRRWLRSRNPNLENDAPLNWLDDGELQSIADLVADMLTGAPT
jgi:hypothetical protein